ncbi:MAG: FAD-dependent oxidoreductase, partial [Pirellulales bacterium]
YELHLPTRPLHEIVHTRMGEWLRGLGVDVRLKTRVDRAQLKPAGETALRSAALAGRQPAAGPGAVSARLFGGAPPPRHASTGRGDSAAALTDDRGLPFDFVILAVPWHRVRGLLPAGLLAWMPQLAALHRFEPAPITAVHLWFDRRVTPLPHAILPGRVGQWLFRIEENERWNRGDPLAALASGAGGRPVRGLPAAATDEGSASATPGTSPAAPGQSPSTPDRAVRYQVLVSAAHEASAMPREQLAELVVAELRQLGPAARHARLLHWRVSTQPASVFSPRPGLEEYRPGPDTPAENLFLAGDWTATGWPSTLESAVRSGRIAAERVLDRLGRSESLRIPDLPPARLARWLLGQ